MKTASKRRPRRGCRAGERRGRPGQGSTGRRLRRSRRRYLRHVPALRRHRGRRGCPERRGPGMADLRLSEWPRYENVARHGPDVFASFSTPRITRSWGNWPKSTLSHERHPVELDGEPTGVFANPTRRVVHTRARCCSRKVTTRSNGSKPNAAATDGRRLEFALMS